MASEASYPEHSDYLSSCVSGRCLCSLCSSARYNGVSNPNTREMLGSSKNSAEAFNWVSDSNDEANAPSCSYKRKHTASNSSDFYLDGNGSNGSGSAGTFDRTESLLGEATLELQRSAGPSTGRHLAASKQSWSSRSRSDSCTSSLDGWLLEGHTLSSLCPSEASFASPCGIDDLSRSVSPELERSCGGDASSMLPDASITPEAAVAEHSCFEKQADIPGSLSPHDEVENGTTPGEIAAEGGSSAVRCRGAYHALEGSPPHNWPSTDGPHDDVADLEEWVDMTSELHDIREGEPQRCNCIQDQPSDGNREPEQQQQQLEILEEQENQLQGCQPPAHAQDLQKHQVVEVPSAASLQIFEVQQQQIHQVAQAEPDKEERDVTPCNPSPMHVPTITAGTCESSEDKPRRERLLEMLERQQRLRQLRAYPNFVGKEFTA